MRSICTPVRHIPCRSYSQALHTKCPEIRAYGVSPAEISLAQATEGSLAFAGPCLPAHPQKDCRAQNLPSSCPAPTPHRWNHRHRRPDDRLPQHCRQPHSRTSGLIHSHIERRSAGDGRGLRPGCLQWTERPGRRGHRRGNHADREPGRHLHPEHLRRPRPGATERRMGAVGPDAAPEQ